MLPSLCTHLFGTAESSSLQDNIFPLLNSFPNSFSLICYCIIFSCANIWLHLSTSEISSVKYLSIEDFRKFQPATESTSSIFPSGIFWTPLFSVQSGSGLVHTCRTQLFFRDFPSPGPQELLSLFIIWSCLFPGSHVFFLDLIAYYVETFL